MLSNAEQHYSATDKELLSVYFAVKKCEFYLVGHNFVVYTDHKPLIFLKTFKALVDKRIRWINYLENLNTVIRYIPGKENVLSDFISRNISKDEELNVASFYSLQLDIASYDENDLRIKQLNDDDLAVIFDFLEKPTEHTADFPEQSRQFKPNIIQENGVLFRKHHGNNLYVVPTEMREELLHLAHSQFLSGHQGRYKTHQRLLQSCWWPSMFRDICAYIDKCKICVMTKTDNRKKSSLGKRPFPRKPNQVISIDFIVDLEKTSKGNLHILTIVDNFSKFIKVYPLKDRTAITASRYVYDFCLNYGIPERLYSDQDPAYEAKLFSELMNQLGVKKSKTTTYNPKANGLCEKSNGIVKSFLLKYVNFFGGEWDKWLRELAYVFNSSVHTTTGFTPFELFFGRKVRIPTDILFDASYSNKENMFSITEFRKKLSDIYELANESMNTRQTKSLSYHDKKVCDDILKENTEVYVYLPRNKREKLTLKWDGPVRIIKEKHPSYLIEFTKQGKATTTWTTREKLRRTEQTVKEANDCRNSYIVPEESDSSDDEHEEVKTPRNNIRYNLRQDIRLPQRYGNIHTHLLEICYGHLYQKR